MRECEGHKENANPLISHAVAIFDIASCVGPDIGFNPESGEWERASVSEPEHDVGFRKPPE